MGAINNLELRKELKDIFGDKESATANPTKITLVQNIPVNVLDAATTRVEALIYNNGTTDVLVLYGASGDISTDLFTYKLAPKDLLIVDNYTGVLSALTTDVTGATLQVTQTAA